MDASSLTYSLESLSELPRFPHFCKPRLESLQFSNGIAHSLIEAELHTGKGAVLSNGVKSFQDVSVQTHPLV